MSIDAYLNFNGNCREAVEFYTDVFGAEKPQLMTFADMPPHPDYPLAEESKQLIMHTQLTIGGSRVMFSDVMPEMPFVVGNNISLAFVTDNKDDIQSAFEKLKVGGTVNMELQETFWSKYFGMVTDKFGVGWQLNLNVEE
ncbi:hypothetical protein CIG75_15965 [Tumebacillus algifaecis]|uniref:Glyoxalase/fosfomycin resistance/dioxygenase domain-containing protein n=1 Tax=Tumebacillus algifaecis TaxID=1214604 RepID=A0A223D4D7_9BACL|nr:VOC family protein [Tumebacillus algifaecis]ASS76293.1 hypothetical protein CIG75_15965 [Tumebacillus algifaecis]